MIQIMIVDDEPLFREFLHDYIPWSDYGFEVVGLAKNGVEALKMADLLQPDIVLTDINMPQMDGLLFATRLLAIAPETGIVFITGHNEFEYARKAIRIGASDYILKPFEKEELILTLLKLKDNIHIANNVSEASQSFDTSLIMPLLTSKFHHNHSALQSQLKELGFNQDHASYLTACLDIDHIDYSFNDQEEKMLWRFSVSNILRELLEHYDNPNFSKGHVFYDYEGNITTILVFKDLKCVSDDTSNQGYLDVFQHLMSAVNKYLNFSLTIGIGTIKSGIEGISTSYNEALSALHTKYVLGNNKIIHFSTIPEESKDYTFYNASFNENLLLLLRSRDKKGVTESLTLLYTAMKKHPISYDFSKIIQMGLISLLISHIIQVGKSIDLIFGKNYSPYKIFDQADTLHLQSQFIISLYHQTLDYFDDHLPSRSQLIAQHAKEYVDEHYMISDLSVQDIANAQYINQTYLRSMFKKEYAMTISDYLTKARMEQAAKLLKEKTHRLSDISEAVGYNDSSYFTKCFKKHFGITPSQFEIS